MFGYLFINLCIYAADHIDHKEYKTTDSFNTPKTWPGPYEALPLEF